MGVGYTIFYWIKRSIILTHRYFTLLLLACCLVSLLLNFTSRQKENNFVLDGDLLSDSGLFNVRPKISHYDFLSPALHRKLGILRHQIIYIEPRPPDTFYNLNVTASDLNSVDRDVTDTRPAQCVNVPATHLPKASVVIPFYNEAPSMLLRTIHSLLRRTPRSLLADIVLVDDASTHDALRKPLEDYIMLLPVVRLIRNEHREGLIRSRLIGTGYTTGKVVVFLDAHTEANHNWLEPILKHLELNPTHVVQPFVDGINPFSLRYGRPGKILHKGGFTWDLRYVWMPVSEHEQGAVEDGQPLWTPTLVGCAIAVDKKHFIASGAFDEEMNTWGGENLELSFRTWLCGGAVVTLPCSRVGHAFRPLPYKHQGNWTLHWQKNLMRVAEVWMDRFKHYFYRATRLFPNRRTTFSPAEKVKLQQRKNFFKQFHCHTFDYYLQHVIPEIPIPPHEGFVHGEITNQKSKACWAVMPDGYINMTYSCYQHKLLTANIFTMTYTGRLMYRDLCVHLHFPMLKVGKCPKVPNYEQGKFRMGFLRKGSDYVGQIHVRSRRPGVAYHNTIQTWCVEQMTSNVPPHRGMQMPQAGSCNQAKPYQAWFFSYRFDVSV